MEGYGPNDKAVLQFLGAVARMTVEQAATMARTRDEADAAALERAGWTVDRAAMMTGRTEELEAARDALRVYRRFRYGVPWYGRALRVYWRRVPRGHFDTMASATPALLDAIGALVVQDVIDAPTFELLCRPWRTAQSRDSGATNGAIG